MECVFGIFAGGVGWAEGSSERLRFRLLGEEERSAGCSGGEPIWSMVESRSHTSGASRKEKTVVTKAVRR